MSKRRLAISALVAAFALILTGCSSSSDEGSADGFVGVILPDAASSARWETADRGFLQAAFDAAGVKADIQNANGDKAAFQTIADQMLSAGAKVLILVNLDSESAKAVQDKAAAQGVPTIDYDRLTLNGSASYYVSFDNEAVGRLQGEGIKACLDAAGKTKARIVYLNGSPTDNNATLFKAGYDSVLRPLIDAGDYTLVDDQAVPDWDNAKGGVIFDGLRAILTGDLSNTVYKAIKAEAEAAAALAIALLNGEEATSATGSVNNGTVDVPSVLLVPVSITKANVADVIADGFQTREAVCEGIEDLCTANGI